MKTYVALVIGGFLVYAGTATTLAGFLQGLSLTALILGAVGLFKQEVSK